MSRPFINTPPVIQIDSDIIASSNLLTEEDVGSWAVVVSNGELILCDSKNEAEEIIEILSSP